MVVELVMYSCKILMRFRVLNYLCEFGQNF